MPANAAAHIVNLPTEIIFKILKSLDAIAEQQGLEHTYNYPKATALGPPGVRAYTNASRFDAISRCCKRLRVISFPFLFRCLRVNVVEEQSAITMLQIYMRSNWILQYVRRLHLVMDIRAIIVAELPMSVMKPDLNLLMNLVSNLFQFTAGVEELHFMVRSEIVSNGLRRMFRRFRQQIETSLRHVKSLKFSAGSEWIIRFCGSYSGLRELENSPGVSGRLYVPYTIDFARERADPPLPDDNMSPTTALSRIGDYRAANILKGIYSLQRGPDTLTKVTIYGRFTRDGLDGINTSGVVFIRCIPVVSYLTIIGGRIEPTHASILGQLSYLRVLNIEDELSKPREKLSVCPEGLDTLWHFAKCIGTLQQMWFAARFVGEVVRDLRGAVLFQYTDWRDTWTPQNVDIRTLDPGDIEMGGN
ncbi:hypothetical protein TWF730_000286 [Orbilia blumenaviensis]|uniref:F-box domain-containing protein n=1 Tax=Orbilia blumenaviensis TaxID=1796055 RepID=A0AAV9VLB6_9PEZI